MITYGEMLAKKHKVLLMQGDLWTGKTLLAKGFAKWLGINDHQVQSPTYAYINIYDHKLLHIDLFRIQTYEELIEKWILAQIHEYDYIVIERPKFIDKIGLPSYTLVDIKKTSEDERSINIQKHTSEIQKKPATL